MAIYKVDDLVTDLPPDGDFWVAEEAVVAGKVRLARGVGVWFGAVLRAEDEWIEIGEGSNVQDGCVIHVDPGYPVTIGRNCTVGHRAVMHGCTIGDNTLVGMSATLLNGARIGANCLIGADCLITEGKVIPDNSLVLGAPGKVVRVLDADAVAKLPLSAQRYEARWRRYVRAERLSPSSANLFLPGQRTSAQ